MIHHQAIKLSQRLLGSYFYAASISNNNSLNLNLARLISCSCVLNGTPKRRVTVERKIRRRYGDQNMIASSLLLNSKNNILVCGKCGSYHEAHAICNNCYDEVRKETLPIVESIRKAQASNAITKEILLRCKGEQVDQSMYDNKQIVETERKRPLWFTDNLLKRKAIPGTNIETHVASNTNDNVIKVEPDNK